MEPEAIHLETEAIWNPPRARSDLDVVAAKEVRVSSLVSLNARDCIKRALGISIDGDMPESNYHGWRGDAMGEAMSIDFSHQEIEVSVPLGNGWTLKGTTDGIRARDNRVQILENKAYGYVQPEKVERAFRQSALYLAMWQHEYNAGVRVFYPKEDYVKAFREQLDRMHRRAGLPPVDFDPAILNFTCGEGLVPDGVIVRVAPLLPEQRTCKVWSLGNSDLKQHLEFYMNKARIVAQGCEAEDPDIGMAWDRENPVEFVRPLSQRKNPPLPVKILLTELFEARKIGRKSDADQERIKAELALAYNLGEIAEGTYPLVGSLEAVVKPPKYNKLDPPVRFLGGPDDSISGTGVRA